jgi:hypothetical protein
MPIENKKTHKNVCRLQKTAENIAKSLFEPSNDRRNEGTMAVFNFNDLGK